MTSFDLFLGSVGIGTGAGSTQTDGGQNQSCPHNRIQTTIHEVSESASPKCQAKSVHHRVM